MTEQEFDAIIARASDPTLIPGIYNYCDRRCGRCRFTRRCFQYRESEREAALTSRAIVGPNEEWWSRLTQTLDMLHIIGKRLGVDVNSLASTAEHDWDSAFDSSQHDPLVRLSAEYADRAADIIDALDPILPVSEDAVQQAADDIGYLSTMIPAKTCRAISGSKEPWFDPEDGRDDAIGSAKLVRLMIRESVQAWRVLMQKGHATSGGRPAQLVAMLERLDEGLDVRFPRCMEFKRPGFDGEDAIVESQ